MGVGSHLAKNKKKRRIYINDRVQKTRKSVPNCLFIEEGLCLYSNYVSFFDVFFDLRLYNSMPRKNEDPVGTLTAEAIGKQNTLIEIISLSGYFLSDYPPHFCCILYFFIPFITTHKHEKTAATPVKSRFLAVFATLHRWWRWR